MSVSTSRCTSESLKLALLREAVCRTEEYSVVAPLCHFPQQFGGRLSLPVVRTVQDVQLRMRWTSLLTVRPVFVSSTSFQSR